MSEQQAQETEPTMEEILASIRRIISEDDEAAEGEQAEEADIEAVTDDAEAPVAEVDDLSPGSDIEAALDAAIADVTEDALDDGVLDLTDTVEDEPALDAVDEVPADDLLIIDAPDEDELAPEPEPVAEAAAAATSAPAEDDSIVSPPVADAAAGAFGSLISNLLVSSRAGEGKTLEDLVAELLRPMLKDWLDANLREIVEARVADEVEKISSRARR